MIAEGGKPAALVSDNGTELTGMGSWLHRPRQPQQNAFIQSLSFNGRLRDALVNETLSGSLAHVRAALAGWRLKYNTIRPHSILGHHARLSTQPLQRDATLRAIVGFLPRPLHHRARLAQNGQPTLLIAG